MIEKEGTHLLREYSPKIEQSVENWPRYAKEGQMYTEIRL
jgi:hypothetical protein